MTRSQTATHALATGLLIASQLLTWVVMLRYYPNGEWSEHALLPGALDLRRLLVAPFVHVNPYHLGVNVAILWLFGSGLERAIGAARFLLLYLLAAWFAGLMYWGVTVVAGAPLEQGSAAGAMGASGGIAGVLGAYSVRLPHRPLLLPFGWRLPPAPLLGGWLLVEFTQAVVGIARGGGAGFANWAHFAGFVFGLAAATAMGLQLAARREQLEAEGRAAEHSEDPTYAAAAWEALLELQPGDGEVRQHLVAARLSAGEQAAAEAAARDGLARAAREGRVAAALADYHLYTQLLPELRLPDGLRYRVGCWLAEAGEDQAAYAALIQAAQEDAATPAAASALFRAGEVAADRLHDPRRARAAWQRILLDYAETPWRDRAYERLRALSGGR